MMDTDRASKLLDHILKKKQKSIGVLQQNLFNQTIVSLKITPNTHFLLYIQ